MQKENLDSLLNLLSEKETQARQLNQYADKIKEDISHNAYEGVMSQLREGNTNAIREINNLRNIKFYQDDSAHEKQMKRALKLMYEIEIYLRYLPENNKYLQFFLHNRLYDLNQLVEGLTDSIRKNMECTQVLRQKIFEYGIPNIARAINSYYDSDRRQEYLGLIEYIEKDNNKDLSALKEARHKQDNLQFLNKLNSICNAIERKNQGTKNTKVVDYKNQQILQHKSLIADSLGTNQSIVISRQTREDLANIKILQRFNAR